MNMSGGRQEILNRFEDFVDTVNGKYILFVIEQGLKNNN